MIFQGFVENVRSMTVAEVFLDQDAYQAVDKLAFMNEVRLRVLWQAWQHVAPLLTERERDCVVRMTPVKLTAVVGTGSTRAELTVYVLDVENVPGFEIIPDDEQGEKAEEVVVQDTLQVWVPPKKGGRVN